MNLRVKRTFFLILLVVCFCVPAFAETRTPVLISGSITAHSGDLMQNETDLRIRGAGLTMNSRVFIEAASLTMASSDSTGKGGANEGDKPTAVVLDIGVYRVCLEESAKKALKKLPRSFKEFFS